MRGMVVAPQPQAAETGVEVLRAGGNAFDAAVAGAFVQMIVDPQNCGVAGFGAATVRTADGREEVIDFNGTAGSRVTPQMWEDIFIEQNWTGYGYIVEGKLNELGYGSIMTPGTVAGMAEVLRRHGTLSWAEALQPAIRVAEEGPQVAPSVWQYWNAPGDISFRPALELSEEGRRVYLKPDGSTLMPNERIINPGYLATLQRLADAGPQDFYSGDLAAEMVADLEANGAYVTADDLASYHVQIVEPIRFTYRGHNISTSPPASGGICLAQILKIVERENLAALGLNSLEYIDLVAHAMKAAFHDWYAYVGDPLHVDVPIDWLLSDERAAEWHARIERREHFEVPLEHSPRHTTNITAADNAGNVIAMTHSLAMPSGVITPGLGFMWNGLMNAANPVPGKPNSIAPGKARLTGICPSIVTRDGELVLALGAPGGTRIITGVLQVLLNVLDFGMSPVEAVNAPRFDCQSEKLDCEARIPTWTQNALAERGFEIVRHANPWGHWAWVQAITRDPETGALSGGSDPRGGGAVMTR